MRGGRRFAQAASGKPPTGAAWMVVAVALTLLAPVLGTSAARAQDQPGRETVTVSAAPRWGRSTPGSWTPYRVTVRNDGFTAVEGEVVLVADPDPPPPPPGTVPAPKPPGPTDAQSPARVVALGATELTVAPPPGPVRGPGDFPTYRAPVTVAAGGGSKELTLLVVEAPYGYRAEVRDGAGRRLARSEPAPFTPGERWRPTVAVLSRNQGAAESIGRLADFFGPQAGAVTAIASSRAFPSAALLLSGLDAVVIDQFDTASLSARQRESLAGFVAFGGGLVLGGGADGARAAASLPEALVPLAPKASGQESLAPLADLVGRTTSLRAAVLTGDVRRGRVVMQAPGGEPLVVAAEYGAGRVVQLAFDPLEEPLASDAFLRDLAWYQGLSRALVPPGAVVAGLAPPEQLWADVLVPSRWPPWPPGSLVVLGALPLVVLPGAYALLRWRRHPQGVWLLAPVLALVATVLVGVAGAGREGASRAAVEVTSLGPGGEAVVSTYGGVQAAGRGRRSIALAEATAGSSTFVSPGRVTAGPRPDAVRAGGRAGTVVQGGGRSTLVLDSAPGEVRHVQRTAFTGRQGLDARLRLVGVEPPDRGGLRVAGTITNRSDRALLSPRIQLPEGAQARLSASIGPGRTVQVDAPVVWPRMVDEGSGIPAAHDELVMFAAADQAFLTGGRVAVVGLSPSGSARSSVVVQVVALEASENVVAGTGRLTVVALDTTAPDAEVHVYDVAALPGAGPVDLYYTAHFSPPEVYDWQAGTWRSAPRTQPDEFEGPALLSDSEVRNGLVRIRTKGDRNRGGYGLSLRQAK